MCFSPTASVISAGLVATPPASIGVATSIAIFALNGYGAAVCFAEETHHAPRRIAHAILLALALALTLVLVASGAGPVAIYAGIACATIAGRRSGATATAPYRMPWYPRAPLATLLALGHVVWTNRLDTGAGRPALVFTAVPIAGSALYQVILKPRGDWRAAAR